MNQRASGESWSLLQKTSVIIILGYVPLEPSWRYPRRTHTHTRPAISSVGHYVSTLFSHFPLNIHPRRMTRWAGISAQNRTPASHWHAAVAARVFQVHRNREMIQRRCRYPSGWRHRGEEAYTGTNGSAFAEVRSNLNSAFSFDSSENSITPHCHWAAGGKTLLPVGCPVTAGRAHPGRSGRRERGANTWERGLIVSCYETGPGEKKNRSSSTPRGCATRQTASFSSAKNGNGWNRRHHRWWWEVDHLLSRGGISTAKGKTCSPLKGFVAFAPVQHLREGTVVSFSIAPMQLERD